MINAYWKEKPRDNRRCTPRPHTYYALNAKPVANCVRRLRSVCRVCASKWMERFVRDCDTQHRIWHNTCNAQLYLQRSAYLLLGRTLHSPERGKNEKKMPGMRGKEKNRWIFALQHARDGAPRQFFNHSARQLRLGLGASSWQCA